MYSQIRIAAASLRPLRAVGRLLTILGSAWIARAPAPPPWVKPWPDLRPWLPGWQMFSARWKTPADPRRAGRIIVDHVLPLFTDESYAVVHRTEDELVLQNREGDTVTIEMTRQHGHTETHIWGVAPRSIRQGLQRISVDARL